MKLTQEDQRTFKMRRKNVKRISGHLHSVRSLEVAATVLSIFRGDTVPEGIAAMEKAVMHGRNKLTAQEAATYRAFKGRMLLITKMVNDLPGLAQMLEDNIIGSNP